MANFVQRKHLSRRAFLGGVGAAVALPWLDAMVPAFAGPKDERRPTRAVFVFAPNGKKMDDWTPPNEGTGYTLPYLLEPLKPHKKSVLVLTGMTIDGGRAHGDGPGDHARSAASFLTCAHPVKTGGADIEAGVSIDQRIASQVGKATTFPSLELGIEGGRSGGVCDSGYSCAYSNNISWRTPSLPMAKETKPRLVFARLFGDPNSMESEKERAKRRAEQRSVLDAALEDAKKLAGKLGKKDRAKLDEYLTAVRELEERLGKQTNEEADIEVPEGLMDSGGYEHKPRLMYDIIALALQSDMTRTITLMLGNGGSNRSYRYIGVPEGHHNISHHGNETEKLEGIRKINRWHMEQFAAFLDRMASIDDGGKSLLDRSLVLYGSGLSDGNRHNHEDLPVLVAGKGNGKWRTGRHDKFPKETPMANLYMAMLKQLDLPADPFADGDKPLF